MIDVHDELIGTKKIHCVLRKYFPGCNKTVYELKM